MLPPPLMVSDAGSFAEYTLKHRKPGIVQQIIDSQRYPAEITKMLQQLIHEIRHEPLRLLESDRPDRHEWDQALSAWRDSRWLDLPWFLAETYFYRRVLEIVGYFEPGEFFLLDPFAPQKREALAKGLEATVRYYGAMRQDADVETLFRAAMGRCLWGNRADLSNISISASSETVDDERHRMLIDDRAVVWGRLARGSIARIDLVADNSGPEILADMGLIALLLEHSLVQAVHLHLKPQPYFVSDAMAKDYRLARLALEAHRDPRAQATGMVLLRAEEEQRLQIKTHPFWASSRHFTELPIDLRQALSRSDLLVLKGDVNYRRLLEDRRWPHTTDLTSITSFMPAPFVTLRTLKAELIVGLAEGQSDALAAEDPNWLVNGERGLIHYAEPHTAR